MHVQDMDGSSPDLPPGTSGRIRNSRAAVSFEERADDAELARRAGLGDREAFAEIFRRHGPALFRYALGMLEGNAADAEDAVQNAWTRVWLRIGTFRGEARLRTWLFAIAAREVLNQRRRRRPVPVGDDLLIAVAAPLDQEPEAHLDHEQLRQALTLALTELPWRQRESWILREMEGLSYDDIAGILGTTPTVVRGQLHRARTSLAARMEKWR
ncbi:RNA polymerase sigma factor [Kineosporia succinea]|uniref:RNA polymerase sigma-70 factor (ECF subfamily) n=1 Tax=Kineosporia succinea TaxID=84632 RepID=A0ABT9PAQ3_9ACTN|nr:RNA polymerase sigma factor [Kineosporia succinea]MDP9829499.1 RNA polymerase sigma-70 factor (ECF subfamily) [Kineosporia succinea]